MLSELYQAILEEKGSVKVLVQTYFGDVRDCWDVLAALPVDGLGLDFIEGARSLELLRGGFPEGKTLFAGVVNGKNIWKNNYEKTLGLLRKLSVVAKDVVIGTSCSLLHVPYTIHAETKLSLSLIHI